MITYLRCFHKRFVPYNHETYKFYIIRVLIDKYIILNMGIKKVSRHTLRAGKSAVYAVSRLPVYYSNSIVAGGFPVQSYSTRFTFFTSLTIRFAARPRTSHGISAASAVIKSIVLTARRATA